MDKSNNNDKTMGGLYLVKELNDYIVSKIQIKSFLDICFNGDVVRFSLSARSQNKTPMRYKFEFNIRHWYIEQRIEDEILYKHIDKLISDTNEYFRTEYLK